MDSETRNKILENLMFRLNYGLAHTDYNLVSFGNLVWWSLYGGPLDNQHHLEPLRTMVVKRFKK